MKTRQFGNTDMQTTPIGLGAWAIGGGGWDAGWGPQDDQESIATIKRALDLGINWIDTAAVYGRGHRRGPGRDGEAARRGQDSLHRCLKLQCRTVAPGDEGCPDQFVTATLFG